MTRPPNWFEKIIRCLLIFFVGGVGSLTYFDAFLPGHETELHPFHISIFEEADHHHHPLPQPELISDFSSQAHLRATPPDAPPGLAQFLQSGLSAGYLLTSLQNGLTSLPLFGRIPRNKLAGRSAWLAPPKKPPSA